MARKKTPPAEPTLNPEQQLVVDHDRGPLRVGAVAGSGKTTALVERVVRLVKGGVDPRRILSISFSRIAREQMQRRIDKRLPGMNAGKCARTFHSIGYDIFRNETGSKAFIDTTGFLYTKAITDAYRRKGLDPQKAATKAFATVVKNDLLGTSEALRRLGKTDPRMLAVATDISRRGSGLTPETLVDAFHITEKIRSREGVEHDGANRTFVTFDDMVYEAAMLLKRTDIRDRWAERWLYILQDEAQDECEAQAVIVEALAHEHKNYMVVGDPSQAIYGWRGARPERMLAFEDHFPGTKTVLMFRNYRSGFEIVDLANRIINHMPARTVITDDFGDTTPMSSERQTRAYVGYHVFETPEDEAAAVVDNIVAHHEKGFGWKEQAVLMRMNRMTRAIELALVQRKVPYKLHSGQSFFTLKETKILLSYFRVLARRADAEALRNALMYPSRKLGRAFVDSVIEIGPSDGDWLPAVAEAARTAQRYQAESALGWVSLLEEIRDELALAPADLLVVVRKLTGLDDWLAREVGEDEDSDAAENLDEVISFASQFDSAAQMVDQLDEIHAYRLSLKGIRNAVQVSTVHKQKGAEYRAVYVIQVGAPFFPSSRSDLHEERRLFYVAVTRAMDELWISRPIMSGRTDGDGNERATADSLFVSEAGLIAEEQYRTGPAVDPMRVGTQIGLGI